MNPERIAESLGLDLERIVAKASATESYGLMLAERAADASTPEEEQRWWVRAAGANTVAGSFWALVDPAQAVAPLGKAEAVHRATRSPYGSFLAICAHPRRPELPDFPVTNAGPQPAANLLDHLWPLAVGETDLSLEQLLADAPALTRVPPHWLSGRLRIPFSHYRALAGEIDSLRQRDRQGAQGGLPLARAFLDRAVETVAAAREDRHHWQRLRSPILPAEPEALAALALLETTARQMLEVSAAEAMEVPPLSLEEALLSVAAGLLDAEAEQLRAE